MRENVVGDRIAGPEASATSLPIFVLLKSSVAEELIVVTAAMYDRENIQVVLTDFIEDQMPGKAANRP